MKKAVMLVIVFALMLAMPMYAQTPAGGSAPSSVNWVALTSGFAMALAAGLGALGQGRVAGSAAEAMARNPGARPGIQLVLILGLAFIESLALFTFAVIFIKVV
ncbi:MAG: ATP synthase F0 subunit C [Acidobacteriales bacterium]|nr:ATP synthase F0 subunit C [Terriglobales bacterium]